MEDLPEVADLLLTFPVPDDAGQNFKLQLLLTTNLGAFGLKKQAVWFPGKDMVQRDLLFNMYSITMHSKHWLYFVFYIFSLALVIVLLVSIHFALTGDGLRE